MEVVGIQINTAKLLQYTDVLKVNSITVSEISPFVPSFYAIS